MYKTTTGTRTSTQSKIIVMVVMVLAVALLPAFGSIAFRGLVALSSNTSTSSMPLPVAHYKFDGNGADSSGNNLPTWPVGVSYTEDGVKGKAGVFGGDGDRLALADNSLLDSQTFTLSGWFYFDGDIGSARLIAKEFDNTKWDYRLLTLDGGVFEFQDALLIQINKAGGGVLQFQANGALANYKNKWVFLSATYNGTNLKLYRDDVEITNGQEVGRTSGATTIAIKNSDAGLGIGAGVSGNASFKGKIDEVKIYNRALSSEEIQGLYILGLTPNCGDGVINERLFGGELEVCDGNSQSCTASNGQPGTQTCRSDCNGWESCVASPVSCEPQRQITTSTSLQATPAIYGDKIVWQDNRHGNPDIYIYNLSNGNETRITTNTATQMAPAIYGDKIVWSDNRHGNPDIYMYNLSNGNETRITTNTANQYNPVIYGDKIVWSDNRHGNYDIYMYDLSNGTETQITASTANQTAPAIYGDKIVWSDNRHENSDIYMYNLSNSSETRITTSTAYHINPAIYGDKIVWQDFESKKTSIYVYDLSIADNLKRLITSNNNSYQMDPAIYGDKIVWQDYRNVNPNIYMYDLSNGTETQITASTANQMAPAIYGDKIVWHDNRNVNYDIYMYDLGCTNN